MPDIYTAAGVHLDHVLDLDGPVTSDPDPRTCDYIHFDLTTEQLGRTSRYNCWGFTFLPRRYWIGSHIDVDHIIEDNCNSVAYGLIRCGDVIRYRDDADVTTHTGRVWQTDGSGHATKIRSKWGGMAEYIHDPLDVPEIYGTNLAYFRQHAPLIGVADLWIKDSPVDIGEQYSGAPWWTSPDILVDVPPYDGNPDINPVFNEVNRVWSRVWNRSNLPVENLYVRYYWADPAAGLPPSSWHLIPGTLGHPNPAGPIIIPGYSSIEAPYVEWTPTITPAHQCLLAIAYINDDPRDSDNRDPLVYPFDIPWDNNIAQRNVHVIESKSGSSDEFSIGVGIPFDGVRKLRGSIDVILTCSHQVLIAPYQTKIVPLEIALVLDGKQKSSLKSWKDFFHPKEEFRPDIRRLRQEQVPGMVLPYLSLVHEEPVAGMEFSDLSLVQEKPHQLDVTVTVPREAKVGSVYYLHIVQQVSNTVTGGYTTAIIVV